MDFAVYVMLADAYEFTGLLIALKLMGLIETGDYVMIGVDSKTYNPADPIIYIQGNINTNCRLFVNNFAFLIPPVKTVGFTIIGLVYMLQQSARPKPFNVQISSQRWQVKF